MNNLSKRLKEIANYIPDNIKMVDIGCDHALLDIYLTLYNDNKCLATDISEGALKQAKPAYLTFDLIVTEFFTRYCGTFSSGTEPL